jgi:hypothetical protein
VIIIFCHLPPVSLHVLHNEELRDLFCSPNIVHMVRSRRMRWAGYVARVGEKRGVKGKGKVLRWGRSALQPSAYCTLTPKEFLNSSPEALHTKRRQRPQLAKEGIIDGI